MRKEELKIGYVVKLRNNQFMMVMETEDDGVILIGETGTWSELHNYGNDLAHYHNSNFNIVEVYGFTTVGCRALEVSKRNRELLWQRKEKRMMTVSEIENILGYEVEIVREN